MFHTVKTFVLKTCAQSVLVLTCLAAVIGFGSLYLSSAWFPEPEPGHGGQLIHELSRDVGVAFVVAAIVAMIYELHARARFDRETLRGVLGSIYNDFVDGRVSDEIWHQVLDKEAVRKNGRITIALESHDDLSPGQYILSVEFEYDLCGLRSTERTFPLHHFLDSFMSNKNLRLPRFDQIVIGDKPYKGKELEEKVVNGVFDEKVAIQSRKGKAVPVMVERHEIVYVPGAYNLIMGELTDDVRIHLHEAPQGIDVELNIKGHLSPLGEGGFHQCHTFFLPQQNIEFRFKPASETTTSPHED